jgi:hypothetical protein
MMVVLVVAIVLLVFSPILFTFCWHLFHGNSVETRGEKVFIPFLWIADLDDAMGARMTKLPLTLLQGVKFDGMISVSQNFSPPGEKTEEIYRSWETMYWNLADAGAVVSGPVRTGSGPHETFCMESSYPKEPKLVSASCLVVHAKWKADFGGNRADLKYFLEIIRKMD